MIQKNISWFSLNHLKVDKENPIQLSNKKYYIFYLGNHSHVQENDPILHCVEEKCEKTMFQHQNHGNIVVWVCLAASGSSHLSSSFVHIVLLYYFFNISICNITLNISCSLQWERQSPSLSLFILILLALHIVSSKLAATRI